MSTCKPTLMRLYWNGIEPMLEALVQFRFSTGTLQHVYCPINHTNPIEITAGTSSHRSSLVCTIKNGGHFSPLPLGPIHWQNHGHRSHRPLSPLYHLDAMIRTPPNNSDSWTSAVGFGKTSVVYARHWWSDRCLESWMINIDLNNGLEPSWC